MKTLLYCHPHPFSSFVPPPPTSQSPLTSTPTVLSVVLFLWLNVWSHHIWCAILHNENMDLHTPSLVTLVPEGTWCVFYATRCKVYWALTQCGFLLVLWFDITHTNTQIHTAHAGASRVPNPYKYIFTPYFIC